MAGKSSNYTLMFIPEDNRKSFTLRVHKIIIYSIIVFLCIFTIGLGLLIFKSGEIAAKLQLVYSLRQENKRLNEENQQLRTVSNKVERLEYLASYLERLAQPDSRTSRAGNKSGEQISAVPDSFVFTEKTDTAVLKASKMKGMTNEQYISSIPNIAPLEGWVTRGFTTDAPGVPGHAALDMAASSGTPVKATAPGVVDDVRNDINFGLIVTVIHDNGFITRYGHCSQILVNVRDRVKRGQTIALVGNTGRSSAPHLHYELIKDGKNIDPRSYFIGHQD